MTRKKSIPYICPRCEYQTQIKDNMRRHLYKNIKECDRVNDIELTDDIRAIIMKYRNHHPPKQTMINDDNNNNGSITNINNGSITNINYYNIVSQMQPRHKLQEYCNYFGIVPINFDKNVELTYYDNIKLLLKDDSKHDIEHKYDDIMKMVNDMVSIPKTNVPGDVSKMNIIFDEHIEIYNDDNWETLLSDTGLDSIITGLKQNYLDYYEKYNIMQIENENTSKHVNLLKDYYKFLACFNMQPFVDQMANKYILGNDVENKDSLDISEKYMDNYDNVKAKLTKTYIDNSRQKLLSIVKNVTKSNTSEINRRIVDLINIDNEFRIEFNKNNNLLKA